MTAEPVTYYLAQANVGRLRAPLNDPQIAGFLARQKAINDLADRSPGFVWRLQTAAGDATSIRINDDPQVILNLSVWASYAEWHRFVFKDIHLEALKLRGSWFERIEPPYSVMWWVPAGHEPPVSEAMERLEHLRVHGDSPHAFSFKHAYPPPA